MKKFLSAVLVCMMVLCCAFGAFALENPWESIDPADMAPTAGFELAIPEGAEVVDCLYNETLGMLELVFVYDGNEYTARAVSTSETEIIDISGMNYDWEMIEEAKVCGRDAIILQATDGENTVQVINWLDVVPGIAYSVSTIQPDVDGLDISAIAEMVFVEMQGEA